MIPLFVASALVERNLGVFFWVGAYGLNCATSALTSVIYQRQIGYKAVQKRGRMANNNGNATLFFAALFSFLMPNYKIYQGRNAATTFYFGYLFAAMCIIYFTPQGSAKLNRAYRMQHNETHWSAVITGALLGLAMRKRLLKGIKV